MQRLVYLDHAATTPVRPEVLEAILPFLGGGHAAGDAISAHSSWGNPSSGHRFGRTARAGLEQARRDVAAAVGCEPGDVLFTSGGTEADNLAIVGGAIAARERGGHMLVAVSSIEHKAILAAAHHVAHLGGREIILAVDGNGVLDLDGLDRALAQKPAVVSVMWVNNETGVVQPVREIAARCAAAGVLFHTDAVQAFGKVPVTFADLPGVFATISGHKIGAPKGIGALIVRDWKAVTPLIHGGGQQFGLRPGTENVAGAVALGKAALLAAAEQATEAARLSELRDKLRAQIEAGVPQIVVHCGDSPRAPHVLSVNINGADSEALLMHLDMAGIAASGGSACTTGAVEPSHVLVGMGVPYEFAVGTLRFSLGHETTEADIDHVARVFPEVVTKVRALSEVLGRA